MKSTISKIALIAVFTTLLLASCGKKKSLTSHIEKDAAVCITTNPQVLIQKGKLLDLFEIDYLKRMLKAMHWFNPDENEDFKAMVKDPSHSGIDMRKDVLIAVEVDEEKGPYFIIGMHLLSDKKMQKYLEKLAPEGEFTPEDKGKYTRLIVNKNGPVFSWNKDYMFFSGYLQAKSPEDLKAKVDKMWNMEKSNSLLAHTEYKTSMESAGDINFWLDYEGLYGNPWLKMNMPQDGINEGLYEMRMFSSVHFAPSEININSLVYQSEESKKMTEKLKAEEWNMELLNYIPNESYVLGSTALNAQEYAGQFTEVLKNVGDNDTATIAFLDEHLKPIIENVGHHGIFAISGFYNDSVKYMDKSYEYIDGRFQVMETERYKSEMFPEFTFALSLKDKVAFQDFMKKDSTGKINEKNGIYILSEKDENYKVYIGLSEDILVMSTDSLVPMQLKKNEPIPNSLKGSEIENKINNQFMYFRANLNLSEYPEDFQSRLGGMLIGVFGDHFKSLEINSTDFTGGDMKIEIVKKETGFIKSIIESTVNSN